MPSRTIFFACALLSLTGCVAAIPLAPAGTTTAARLCDMTKLPGETISVCDRLTTAAAQSTGKPSTVR